MLVCDNLKSFNIVLIEMHLAVRERMASTLKEDRKNGRVPAIIAFLILRRSMLLMIDRRVLLS